LAGFEYTAKYNLGYEVPFVEYTDTTGKYHHTQISASGRGEFRPIYELVWNHYIRRRGIAALYSLQAADSIRPEGAGPYADCCGFGTLLFSLPISGDFTGDGFVDVKDLGNFCEFWLQTNCNEIAGLDLNNDCIINLYEFSLMARNWLEGSR
jgi:hypothetical protein